MISAVLADILLAIGSAIGLITKIYALLDKKTSWSRKSSGVNVAFYPFTAILPFLALELWFTFGMALMNFLVWLGIFIYRAPEDEDWLGRT